MKVYLSSIEILTHGPMSYYDLTDIIEEEVARSNIEKGIIRVHAKGSTPGVFIARRNSLKQIDGFIKNLIPVTGWKHGNAYAHLRSLVFGTGLSIPVSNRRILLPREYRVYFVETRPVHSHRRTIYVVVTGE